jgi:methionyl-tRNA synthetase
MIQTYCGGRVPAAGLLGEPEEALIDRARRTLASAVIQVEEYRVHQAIEETMELARAVNRYLEVKAPWKAFKIGGAEAVETTLHVAAEALRVALTLLVPVMPAKAGEGLHRLGILDRPEALVDGPADPRWLDWGVLPAGAALRPGGPLFPRIETEAGGAAPPLAGTR